MNLFAIIDLIQRKINSIIFRFIIIAYSICIVYLYDNIFPIYIYWLAIPIYLIMYYILIRKDVWRLLNDFLFVILVIIGKNPNETFLFVYLILLIINSINFSGTKRSWILYVITIFAYYFILSFYHNKIDVQVLTRNYYPIISIVFLFLIESYTAVRVKFRDFIEQLNAVVDSFYTEKEYYKKPHKLYPELIDLINNRIKQDLIENIYCFTTTSNTNRKLQIVNSSNFIWNFKLDEKYLWKEFEKKKYLLNVKLTIDNKNFDFNCILKCQIEEVTYFYIITTKRSMPFYYELINFMRVLNPTFTKISTVLFNEKRLQEINVDEFMKLAEQMQYVARANKTMHFIRNRLGPIKNLIEMLDSKYLQENDENKKLLEGMILEEKNRAKIDFQEIIKRADYLLEKSHNPFNFTDTSNTNIKKIYSLFAKQTVRYFPNIDINREVISDEFNDNYHIEINKDGFDLLMSDWLCNMQKYHKSNIKFFFTVQDYKLKIEFWNDFKNGDYDIKTLITDMKSPDRNEIMKRKTHGLFQIKSCLEDMNIKYDMSVILGENVKFLVFELFFNLIKDEDSNI